MSDLFFQIVLFLAGALLGLLTQIVSRHYLKLLLTLLAILLITSAALWSGYELGRSERLQRDVIILSVSTFDKGDEGWAIGGGSGPYYKTSGGNPGGYIIGREIVGEYPDWFWSAPPIFLGDKSKAYGGMLFFSLAQNDTSNQYETTKDVLLIGDITLYLDISNPGMGWTEYAVWLHKLGGGEKKMAAHLHRQKCGGFCHY